MLWKKSANGPGGRLMRRSHYEMSLSAMPYISMKAARIWPRSGASDAFSLRRGIDNGQPILRGDLAVQKPDLSFAHGALLTPSSRHALQRDVFGAVEYDFAS